ncbi:hypothetical protein Esti_000637 [Eimeria stiedai]
MTETAAVPWSVPVVTSRPARSAREGPDEGEPLKLCSRAPSPVVSERLSSCWVSARCIAHVDADCFYAQVEELADPALRFRLLAVRQKHLVVACSLNTRAAVGNLKGLSSTEALKRCPSLHIANGEDLTKYRRVSDRLLLLLQGQPWRGDFSEEKAWLAKQPEGSPRGRPSLGPAVAPPAVFRVGTRVPSSGGQEAVSSSSCSCCCSCTAAARVSWSAVSAAVAVKAARPGGIQHSVQRLGLDDFYVDVSAAARTVTGCLLSTLQRVCHAGEGVEEASEACCCSMSISIAQATQQPRSSGTLLPSSAISCRSCSCCMSFPLQSKAAHATAAAAEPEKRTDAKRVSCCCRWDLQCPAFVYNGSKGDGSRSAEMLLQEPLLLAPLLAVLRQGGHLASLVNTACPPEQSAVSPAGGLDQQQQQQEQQQQQQQQELSGSSTGPTQQLPADGAVEGHERQQLKHFEQLEQQPDLQQQVNGAAARPCLEGGDCVCGVQRLLLVVAAHLAEAMRGLIFSSLGGLTTTGGVSINKSLAKLAAKLHKPSQQTLLLREHRRGFLEGRLLRSLPGIGSVTARRLAAASINTCNQLLAVSPQRVAEILSSVDPPPPRSYSSARQQQQQEQQQLRLRWPACVASPLAAAQAERLRLLCLGDEEDTVQGTACASKTMTVEDSYATRPITSWIFLKTEIKRLVRRLLLRHAEWVDRFGLVASSLKVSLRILGSYSLPYDNAWATKGIVVFSLTFYGFEASAPSRSSSSPGDHVATPCRTHSPIEAFGKRTAERQQQQQLLRQRSQPASRSSCAVAPASCSSAPEAFDDRGGERSPQQSRLAVKRNSTRETLASHGGAVASSAANAAACSDSKVLITVSSRESSPEPSSMRGSDSSAHGVVNIFGGVDAVMNSLPSSSPAVESNLQEPPRSGLGATEVVEVESGDSAEEASDAGTARSRLCLHQGKHLAKQYNAQQPFANLKSSERSCLAGNRFKASPTPAGLQEARSTPLQRSKRVAQRRSGEQATAGRAKRRRRQGREKETSENSRCCRRQPRHRQLLALGLLSCQFSRFLSPSDMSRSRKDPMDPLNWEYRLQDSSFSQARSADGSLRESHSVKYDAGSYEYKYITLTKKQYDLFREELRRDPRGLVSEQYLLQHESTCLVSEEASGGSV